MKSRYDYFEESTVLDIDGTAYPDPLTVNYNEGRLTKIPTEITISARNLAKFWTLMYEEYSQTYHDDLLLNENGVPYVMCLRPGDIILKPVQSDLTGFIESKAIGFDNAG